MLKRIGRLVGETFSLFFFFFSRKEQGRTCNFIKIQVHCILLRIGGFLFYFAFLLIKKKQSRLFETGSIELVETRLFYTPKAA